GLRRDVQNADDAVAGLRADTESQETSIRDARGSLETIRATVGEFDIARATAESALAHLASSCVESVRTTLDQVVVEVGEMERRGQATPDARVICADDVVEADEEVPADDAAVDAAVQAATERALSAEDAIAQLRAKIDRLGPVNMMAIEQFDELETRHG